MVEYNFDTQYKGVSVRFEFESSTDITRTSIHRIAGFVRAKYLIPLIDELDLQANPRDAKTGTVTDDIQYTIEHTPELFPVKSKGLLLAASEYEDHGHGRITIFFDKRSVEGILDGGHNTLAIGMYILTKAMEMAGGKLPRGQKTWTDFKQLWNEHRDAVSAYQAAIRKSDDADPGTSDMGLSFYVPVELLVPSDPRSAICKESFRTDLLDICEARNNNAELAVSAKANQKGYFNDLKRILEIVNPRLVNRIEWKTNDGGDIKVQDIIALTWIVLRHVADVTVDGHQVAVPAPPLLYSGKAACLKAFRDFMSSPDVTSQRGDYTVELVNNRVLHAFRTAADIPALYDYIYGQFPSLYNRAGGSYGSIEQVKKLNKTNKDGKSKEKKAPFNTEITVEKASPAGYIMPLVYGLTVLVDPATLDWRTDPWAFLDKYLPVIVEHYFELFRPLGYDPQKIGKAALSYKTVEDAFRMALNGMFE